MLCAIFIVEYFQTETPKCDRKRAQFFAHRIGLVFFQVQKREVKKTFVDAKIILGQRLSHKEETRYFDLSKIDFETWTKSTENSFFTTVADYTVEQ